MFDRFLVFTNHTALYVMDMEEYIASPKWFTPKQIRLLCLEWLIRQYSGNMYTEINNIVGIRLEDTCEEHLTVFIFTENEGIIMLEINKASFYSDRWHNDPLFDHGVNADPSNYFLYQSGGKNYSIIADGRLLQNYYDLSYTNILYDVNYKMMGMLIRIDFGKGYHIYIFRCINLMTQIKSMVYFDKPIPQTDECKSIFIEDDDLKDGIVTFTIL
jgi:hypothetical protein